MERTYPPKDNFLKEVRSICDKMVLSILMNVLGFRETFGGLHKKYNVEPDMAIFVKRWGMDIPSQQF